MEQKTAYIVVGIFAIGLIALYGLSGSGFMGGLSQGNDQNIDKRFIEEMIPHHEGAIAMAELALERSDRPEILNLARGIIEAQQKEIVEMKDWYMQWFGQQPPVSGEGHGMMHMDGMTGDLDVLKSAVNFDQEFIRQMIPHHEMAVMMARMLSSGSARSEMVQLANQIISSQSQEIETMRSWAASWFGM